jgi:hypothetical protein
MEKEKYRHMEISDKIYHYTDIETLALILQSGKIRFNRLDKVIDLSEARSVNGINFGKLFFVSCWTTSADESIPLWRLYTERLAGVRICLPMYPFVEHEFDPPSHWGFEKQGKIYSPIPFEEAWNDSFFIVPQFLDKREFGEEARYVKYVKNVQAEYEKSVDRKVSSGSTLLNIENLFDLARLKTAFWRFEEEYRFALFILPGLHIPRQGPSASEYWKVFPEYTLQCLLDGKGPNLEYFDVQLAPAVLEEITITLGPCCTEGSRILVESLLHRYAKRGHVEASQLAGTIRLTG